jgi:TonB-dependent SusC/RagA subfamily outer membrane receptor
MPGTITLEKYESILDSLSALEKEGKFILLEEVTVEDKSLFEEVDDEVYRPYGIPDAIIEIDDRDKNAINVLQYLQGKIPGVFVNQYTDPTTGIEKYNVQIRGIRSINLEKSPLILIDGIPFEGDVSLINPRDVKSIEILKDPTNLGMYGIRGANGIIAINTDKNPGIVLKEKDENLIILKVPGYLEESSIFGYAPGSAVGKGLIYWNANLQTNEEGDVKLFLPGIKLPEEYYVFIEGITRSGIPFNQRIKVFN